MWLHSLFRILLCKSAKTKCLFKYVSYQYVLKPRNKDVKPRFAYATDILVHVENFFKDHRLKSFKKSKKSILESILFCWLFLSEVLGRRRITIAGSFRSTKGKHNICLLCASRQIFSFQLQFISSAFSHIFASWIHYTEISAVFV